MDTTDLDVRTLERYVSRGSLRPTVPDGVTTPEAFRRVVDECARFDARTRPSFACVWAWIDSKRECVMCSQCDYSTIKRYTYTAFFTPDQSVHL